MICLATLRIQYVHVKCLQRWRNSSPTASAFFTCPQCHYQYRFARTQIVGLATNPGAQYSVRRHTPNRPLTFYQSSSPPSRPSSSSSSSLRHPPSRPPSYPHLTIPMTPNRRTPIGRSPRTGITRLTSATTSSAWAFASFKMNLAGSSMPTPCSPPAPRRKARSNHRLLQES